MAGRGVLMLIDALSTTDTLPDGGYPWQTTTASTPSSRTILNAAESSRHTPDLEPIPRDLDAVTVHTPSIVLSQEQRAVLEMVQRGENVFFTGSAGNDTQGFGMFSQTESY
jgi:hypothetical protein